MSGDLNDLRERMLDRRKKHHAQNRVANGIAFAVFTLSLICLSIFLWYSTIPPEFRTDHAAAHIGSD